MVRAIFYLLMHFYICNEVGRKTFWVAREGCPEWKTATIHKVSTEEWQGSMSRIDHTIYYMAVDGQRWELSGIQFHSVTQLLSADPRDGIHLTLRKLD